MDWKLELISIPVSDVDRSIAFYTDQVGFHLDHDHHVSDELRFVQITPPGSGCSISFGTGISTKEPGSVEGLQIVVSDVEAARAQLVGKGVEEEQIVAVGYGAADPVVQSQSKEQQNRRVAIRVSQQ